MAVNWEDRDATRNTLSVRIYDAALGRGDAPAAPAGIDPTQSVPATLFDRAGLTSLAMPTSQRLRLPSREDAATGAAAAVFCKAGYGEPGELAEACRRVQFNQPGNPEQLALTWDGTGGVYEMALPEEQRNLSDYAMLHLRAAVDPLSPLNAPGQPQSFSLQLTDGAGKTAAIVVANEPALAFPAGKKGFDDVLNLDTWDNHVILSSIRVPLSAFTGVDLNDVRSVALVFDATDRGAIFVADLELLRNDMTHMEQPKSEASKPEYVSNLEAVYGAPSQAAFGSAVFHEQLKATDDLERAAQAKYKYFDSAVTELSVYNIGDGGAMSGLLVAGCRGVTAEAAFLVFFLD